MDKNLIDNQNIEESKIKSFIKKLSLFLIFLFLLYLFLSIFLFGFNIFSILEGRVESNKLDSFKVDFKNGSVIFNEDVYSQLKQIYLTTQKNEFKVCLTGYKKDLNYFVDGLYIPKTFEQTFNSVEAQICDDKTIISLHSHPFKRCLFSSQDIQNFNYFRKINPDGIIGLMCEVDRFTFYS